MLYGVRPGGSVMEIEAAAVEAETVSEEPVVQEGDYLPGQADNLVWRAPVWRESQVETGDNLPMAMAMTEGLAPAYYVVKIEFLPRQPQQSPLVLEVGL